MSYYTFDETNFDTFDASKLLIEEGKRDIGSFKVCYFNIKYKNDDGSASIIKIKSPVLTTPFGINKNQFGKTQLTVNLPVGDLHKFLTNLQNAIKQYICNNIKFFNKSSTKQKITVEEFDILSTAFDIVKAHKEDTKFDDTVNFDISSEFTQRNLKFFDNNKKLINDISYEEGSDNYIYTIVPSQTQLRIVFNLNSICMYGEARGRKFTLKKNPMQILIVSTPASNDVCEFSDNEIDEDMDEDDNDDEWEDN